MDYKGSLLWHRLATYAYLIDRSDWQLRDDTVWLGNSRLVDHHEALADVYNRLAFLELIKCSPEWERSTPTRPMWSNCPKRFFHSEIDILKPPIMLILGKETLRALPFKTEGLLAKTNDGLVSAYQCTGCNSLIINVIHPAAPDGAAEKIVTHIAELLLNPALQPLLQKESMAEEKKSI